MVGAAPPPPGRGGCTRLVPSIFLYFYIDSKAPIFRIIYVRCQAQADGVQSYKASHLIDKWGRVRVPKLPSQFRPYIGPALSKEQRRIMPSRHGKNAQ